MFIINPLAFFYSPSKVNTDSSHGSDSVEHCFESVKHPREMEIIILKAHKWYNRSGSYSLCMYQLKCEQKFCKSHSRAPCEKSFLLCYWQCWLVTAGHRIWRLRLYKLKRFSCNLIEMTRDYFLKLLERKIRHFVIIIS